MAISNDPLLDEKDLLHLHKHRLRPLKIIKVNINDLKHQHRTELDYDFMFRSKDGNIDYSITNSPLYRTLKLYQKIGQWRLIWGYRRTEYYTFFKHADKVGFIRDWLAPDNKIIRRISDKEIKNKLKRFIKLYENIRKTGYLAPPLSARYISVLAIPYETLCLNIDFQGKPYEIWSGHHRAAALAALGEKEIDVVLLDKAQG
ncbi:MAG: hypothetical protein OEU95_01385 [Nitrospirota bacterium]|nr:hypothetical protein [Nitrospirota bacterium]